MRAVIWMDSRGAAQVRRVIRGFPAVQGYGVGRLAAWVRRSGGAPGRIGTDTVAHILSVRDRRPDLYRRATCSAWPAWTVADFDAHLYLGTSSWRPPAVHLCVTLRHTEPGVADRFLPRPALPALTGNPLRATGM